MKALLPLAFLACSCVAPNLESTWYLATEASGGTAVVIASEPVEDGEGYHVTFLTAAHVLVGGDAVHLWADGRWSKEPAERVIKHPELDLPRPGTELYVAGFPMGNPEERWIAQGLYSGGNRLTALAFPGSSGGPVLNRRGRVLGIITNVAFDGRHIIEDMAYFLPVAEAWAWLGQDD